MTTCPAGIAESALAVMRTAMLQRLQRKVVIDTQCVTAQAAFGRTHFAIAAWDSLCTGDGVLRFTGTLEPHSSVRGARAAIERYNHGLCLGQAPRFASDWVAVVRQPTPNGFNIYQIGYDECAGVACPAGAPVGSMYFFYAYGREASALCGQAVGPVAVPAGGAPGAGNTLYEIEKLPVPDMPNMLRYYAQIANVTENSRSTSDLEGCWGGVNEAQLLNETLDAGTQVGGGVGNTQVFNEMKWKNSNLVWRDIARAPGSECDLTQLLFSECETSAGGDDNFRWDTREP